MRFYLAGHFWTTRFSLIVFVSRLGTSRASAAYAGGFLLETEAARALTGVNESAKGRCLYALRSRLARESLNFFSFFFPQAEDSVHLSDIEALLRHPSVSVLIIDGESFTCIKEQSPPVCA
jgi:hypothetical protein